MTAKQRKEKEAGGARHFRALIASHRVFIAILASGILIRVWNLGWGLPYLYEEAIPLRFGMKLWPSLPPSIDFHFFVYPAFAYYLQLLVQFLHFCVGYATGTYVNLAAFIALFDSDPSTFTIVARVTTVIADAGIITVCYHLLDRHFNRASALIAAALIAFNVLHLKQSHLVNVDTLLTLFSVILLLALFRLAEKPSTRNYLIAGIALGLASASKYNGAVLAVAVLATHFFAVKRPGEAFRPERLFSLSAAGAVSVMVFMLFNPLIIPHFDGFLEKFSGTESHMEAGHLGLDPDMSTATYYFLHSLPGNLGIPIALTALISAVWMAFSRERKRLQLLLIPAIYVILLASWEMRADRYIFPTIPFLLMIAAVGISTALSPGRSLRIARRISGRTTAESAQRWITGAAVALLMIPSLLAIAAYQRTAGLKDTRTAAMEWIERSLKPGSSVATGPFGIELSTRRYLTLPIQFSAVRSEQMTPFYNPEWYKGIDLVVVSDFDYGRYRLEPGRFATILGYLDTLRRDWRVVGSFEPGDSLTGPGIWLYEFPGEVSDRPIPPEVLAELLDSDLDTERKVAFLGKLGLILSLEGDLTRSEQLLRTVLTLDPGNESALEAHRNIVTFQASLRKETANAAAPASLPGTAEAHALVARGDSLLAAGDLAAAEKAYRDALVLDRRIADAYLGLTLVHASRDDKESVVKTLKELLAILPPESEDYKQVLWQLKSIGAEVP